MTNKFDLKLKKYIGAIYFKKIYRYVFFFYRIFESEGIFSEKSIKSTFIHFLN